MPTVDTSASPYATGADLVARYDVRPLSQWISDTGVPVAVADVPTDARVIAALAGASGDVEESCFVAGRYRPADLQALTGNALAGLVDLVCGLAWCRLYKRRNQKWPEVEYKPLVEKLDRLRKGENIFGLVAQEQAGVPSRVDSTLPPALPSLTQEARRYFGSRLGGSGWWWGQ